MAQGKRSRLGTVGLRVGFLALLSGSRIQPCCELWCSLQTQLGSGVAVALVQASSNSSDSTPSLGTSICHGCGPKKTRKEGREGGRKEGNGHFLHHHSTERERENTKTG